MTTMETRAIVRGVRLSADKGRLVADMIRGKKVDQAINILTFTPKKAAFLIGKTLRSAIANAEHNHEMDAEDLVVVSAVATDGPALKRIMPRARGSAAPIKKRMCHITVIVAAKTAVSAPTSATVSCAAGASEKSDALRAIMYTPAVTIVAAWISAETGVGPAIASGSQT